MVCKEREKGGETRDWGEIANVKRNAKKGIWLLYIYRFKLHSENVKTCKLLQPGGQLT